MNTPPSGDTDDHSVTPAPITVTPTTSDVTRTLHAAQARKQPVLIATRGLPAAGKTTWALQQIATHPLGTIARCNRDDIRRMTQGSPRYDPESEAVITVIQHDTISTLLHTARIVIVDDTNLDDQHLGALALIAHTHQAGFQIADFRAVPLDLCIERDRNRPHRVGESVIRAMWDRHLATTPSTRDRP